MEVRLATETDGVAVQAIYAPIVADTAISFELDPPTATEMCRRIGERLPLHPWLVAEEAGEVLGYASAGPFSGRSAYRFSVETSAYVAAPVRGHGVGRALYRSLLALLTAQGFTQALAGIALPNAASVSLHERAGFRQVGVYRRVGWKLERWHDVGWWQVQLASDEAPPARLLSVTELEPGALRTALASGLEPGR